MNISWAIRDWNTLPTCQILSGILTLRFIIQTWFWCVTKVVTEKTGEIPLDYREIQGCLINLSYNYFFFSFDVEQDLSFKLCSACWRRAYSEHRGGTLSYSYSFGAINPSPNLLCCTLILQSLPKKSNHISLGQRILSVNPLLISAISHCSGPNILQHLDSIAIHDFKSLLPTQA